MSMTSQLKDELATVRPDKPCCCKAEVTAMIRLAGILRRTGNLLTIEVALDRGTTAARLRAMITGIYDLHATLTSLTSRTSPTSRTSIDQRPKSGTVTNGPTGPTGHLIRITTDGAALARLTGLVDPIGHPVRGLPRQVLSTGRCCQMALWRGAILATGRLSTPGRGSCLQITCPTPETAVALVGAARRVTLSAKWRPPTTTPARHEHPAHHVTLRDPDDIATLLARTGAYNTLHTWQKTRQNHTQPTPRHSGGPVENLGQANLDRSERAAHATCERVMHAFALLGDTIPPHLRVAGQLRLDHPHATLEHLGALHEPPLSKDAIAGRIRRLLTLAHT